MSNNDNTGLKAAVRGFWDRKPCGVKNASGEPGTLAFFEEVEVHRYQEEFHIPLVVKFKEHVGRAVLEVGCGLGTDGRQFARSGAKYVGCDLSFNSLSMARRGFELFGLAGSFLEVDAEDLPFQDDRFDLVYSHGVLHHTPNTEKAIGEVHRVLREGGKAVIMLYARESFGYAGAQTLGRVRLELARIRMGRDAFYRFVGLPSEHRGWLPGTIVINNSTDGLGNPLSKLYTRKQLRQMFSGFRMIRFEKHYFPRRKVPIAGKYLPLSAAYHLGRIMGSFWYVEALK